MKFKVGDRVKFVKSIEIHSNKVKLGGIYKIKHVNSSAFCTPYRVENGEWFGEEELLKEYTYEDLRISPVGTKITFENGLLVKTADNYYRENSPNGRFRDYKNLKELKDNFGVFNLGKIIKIEEPEYKTVYESKVEILDETEKRYLRGVITPFKDSIETIRRLYSPTKEKDYIQIRYKDDRPTNFPYFESNTMYKCMELNKNYTLEELGL